MLAITVKNAQQNTQLTHPSGPLDLGRGPQTQFPRCTIDDRSVSRDQLRVEELPGGLLRAKNLSERRAALLAGGSTLEPGETRELPLPLTLTVGETTVGIVRLTPATAPAPARPAARPNPSQALTLPPPSESPEPAAPSEPFADEGYDSLRPVQRAAAVPALPPLGDAPTPETLARWMETVLALQRSDAGPAEFYAQSARILVNMIGLDVGLVLLHDRKNWKVVARAARDEDDGRPTGGREFSQTVLRQVLAEKQTFYQDLGALKAMESLATIDAVVVSPIFGLREEVAGALYGLRRSRGQVADCKITPLEAHLVQVLAAAAGANLARTAATRTRTQFEQFFSPELVRELERDPALLDGRAHDVTILMSDIRGFSSFAERLGPEQTCRLVRDVMERLSERIVEHAGTIVVYLGDGILAMWNAPVKQDDHAIRACRAALAMQCELPALNAVWAPIVGHPLSVGIGINTGPAQVGNIGSSRKFTYGPLGNTVNLASRVEGATKHLQVPILITGSTRDAVGQTFMTRRLCQVRVVGIQEAVHLHELQGEAAPPEWLSYRDTYEAALAMYEARDWLRTCQTLLPLLEQTRNGKGYDHATLKLMKRSWACLEDPPDPFDPALELTSK